MVFARLADVAETLDESIASALLQIDTIVQVALMHRKGLGNPSLCTDPVSGKTFKSIFDRPEGSQTRLSTGGLFQNVPIGVSDDCSGRKRIRDAELILCLQRTWDISALQLALFLTLLL
jgi:hypothetical protein